MAVREAELRFKPTMGDGARKALRKLKSEGVDTGRAIANSFDKASREGRQLERTYDSVGRAASRASAMTGSLIGQAMSLKGIAVGIAAGGGGKTIFDAMIGSNATLESQRITFNTMMGDVGKATKLMNQLRGYAASTPFAQGDLIDGSKRLLRLTGENVDQNVKLVKLASQMAAINPDKTISDAAEAILDAEGLEFERLKEFGLKLKRDDLKKMKKRGESLGQAALRGVEEALAKQTGGRDVVAALSQSFNGKLSTLKDNFTEMMREAGEPGFEVLKNGLDDIGADFEKLKTDPQFKKDLKDLAEFTSDMAKSSVELARALPGAVRDARAFLKDNQNILLGVGGALAVNKLTGGAAASGVGAVGRRVLFGGRKGGAGTGANPLAAHGGATPVYVVNMGAGGMGGADSFLQRNSGSSAKLTRFKSAGGMMLSNGLLGGGGAIGAGLGAGLFTAVGALLTFADVTSRTGNIIKKYEDAEKKRLDQIKKELERGKGPDEFGAREKMLYSQALRTGDLSGRIRSKDFAGAAGAVFSTLGGKNKRFTGSAEQMQKLDLINEILLREGAGRFEIKQQQEYGGKRASEAATARTCSELCG